MLRGITLARIILRQTVNSPEELLKAADLFFFQEEASYGLVMYNLLDFEPGLIVSFVIPFIPPLLAITQKGIIIGITELYGVLFFIKIKTNHILFLYDLRHDITSFEL
jgi:hypothetical protein